MMIARSRRDSEQGHQMMIARSRRKLISCKLVTCSHIYIDKLWVKSISDVPASDLKSLAGRCWVLESPRPRQQSS